MLSRTEPSHKPPDYLKGKIPSVAALATALESALVYHPAGALCCRAAWGSQYILPDTFTKAYRFGPPRELRPLAGALPFAWLYLAFDLATAIWESQFAKSDATAAGEFYLDPAAGKGVLAEIRFSRELVLWDLTGEACSTLGIFDTISSGDHEACQWIGYHLREAMLQCERGKVPDGFLYPSRRMRGEFAMAIRSDLVPDLQKIATVVSVPFNQSAEYGQLFNHPLRVDPPDPTGSFGPQWWRRLLVGTSRR